jgi:tRNA threonylcarbamoyl adenosine modification protein YjeE
VNGERTIDLADASATESLGRELAGALQPGDLVLLGGPLGAGKTTLVRGLVAGLGGEPALVGSPTFILMESYPVRRGGIRRLHHADLYRVRGRIGAPTEEIGLGEVLDDGAGVVAVEWPEGWPEAAGLAVRTLSIALSYQGSGRVAVLRWQR